MLLLDITIVNVALPDVQRALNSTFSDLQWIVDAYALTLAAFLLTAGSLADLYGRRRWYLIELAIFTCASLLCGFAATMLMLQLSQGLQGVGGAIMFMELVARFIEAHERCDTEATMAIAAKTCASPYRPTRSASTACCRSRRRWPKLPRWAPGGCCRSAPTGCPPPPAICACGHS